MITLAYLFMIGKTAIYVVDIVKDVKFIHLFNSVILEKDLSDATRLLKVGLISAIGFLILSEIFKMLQLYFREGLSRTQKLISVMISPFQLIPILIHHYERKLELKKHILCNTSKQAGSREAALIQTRNELNYILRLKGEHRATENVLEHFVQFLLSFAVLANQTLRTSGFLFSLASCIISLLSMVRGQINLISSQKNGQLRLLARFIIAIYLTAAIFTRAGIILFSIGATFGLQQITYNDFAHGHVILILCVLVVASLHIISSYLIQKWLLKGTKSNLKEALWSFLSPPLYLDWEYLYRKENYEIPISECWRRTRNSFLFHNLLTFVGNLAFGIPVYIEYNILNLDSIIMLSLALILPIISQPILIGLGFLYFKKSHPWARILNAELNLPNPSNENPQQKPRARSFHVHPSGTETQTEYIPPAMNNKRRKSF